MLIKDKLESINKYWDSECKNKGRQIYQWRAVNYKRAELSERVIQLILNDIQVVKEIKETKREKVYINHTSTSSQKTSNREEDRFSMALCHSKGYSYVFGKGIEYQMPLKPRKIEEPNKEYRKGYGKIDLICHKDDTKFFIVEVKKSESPESLLRTILESYTYFKQGANKLKYELEKKFKIEKLVIKPAILIYENSRAARELKKLTINESMTLLLNELQNDIGEFSFFLVKGEKPIIENNGDKVIFGANWNNQKIIEIKTNAF